MNLLLGQETREEVARPHRVSLADSVIGIFRCGGIITKHLGIGSHLFLQDEEVHHLMEHGECALSGALHALVRHFSGSLSGIYFKRFDALSKVAYLLMNARQVTLKGAFQDGQGTFLLQLSLFESVKHIEPEAEQRVKEAFSRASLVPSDWLSQMSQDSFLAVVIDY